MMYHVPAMGSFVPGTDIARTNVFINVGNFAMVLPHSNSSEEHPDSTINQ